MTEKQLIAKLVKLAKSEVGDLNQITVDYYNNIKKKDRSALTANSPTCVAWLSCLFHKAGMSKIVPIEAYVPYFVDELKKLGGKILSSKSKVFVGCTCVFDWYNDGTRDHVGYVIEVKDGWVTTVEGNYSTTGKVGTRRFRYDDTSVEYYIAPDYGAIATKEPVNNSTKTKVSTPSKTAYIVKKGDTLSSIAAKHGTSFEGFKHFIIDRGLFVK